jgi:hypothetical protein
MATNAEQLQQHVKSNPGVYRAAIAKGVITEDDLKIAGNSGGNYSYADQDAALQRINDAFGEYVKKNPDHEQLQKFVSGIPKIDKFTPNQDDWQSYNQEQLARLAEQMKFNWKNKDDRSQMMKQLMNAQIVKNKKKIYDDYKKENPKIAWLNENVVAPNTSNRLANGEDITNTDIALDIANNAVNLVPGGFSAPRLATVFGAEAANTLAQDINQGNELGMHNVVQPLLATGLGAATDAGKYLVDVVKNVMPKGGTIGKLVDKGAKKAEDLLSNEAEVAARNVDEAAEAAKRSSKARQGGASKNYDRYEEKTLAKGEKPLSKAELEADKLARKRKEILSGDTKAKWEKLSTEERRALMQDDSFAKTLDSKLNPKPQAKAKTAVQTAVKAATRGSLRAEGQERNAMEKKPNIEKVFASPELADYIRLKKRGYQPQIPEKFREYKNEIDAKIYDYRTNLLGE